MASARPAVGIGLPVVVAVADGVGTAAVVVAVDAPAAGLVAAAGAVETVDAVMGEMTAARPHKASAPKARARRRHATGAPQPRAQAHPSADPAAHPRRLALHLRQVRRARRESGPTLLPRAVGWWTTQRVG